MMATATSQSGSAGAGAGRLRSCCGLQCKEITWSWVCRGKEKGLFPQVAGPAWRWPLGPADFSAPPMPNVHSTPEPPQQKRDTQAVFGSDGNMKGEPWLQSRLDWMDSVGQCPLN